MHLGIRGSREFLFKSVFVVLIKPPEQIGIAIFGIDREHAKFDKFVWSDFTGPRGADDRAFRSF
jgi:hypothetical protein